MSEQSSTTRRSFVKGAAAAAAAAALPALAVADEASQDIDGLQIDSAVDWLGEKPVIDESAIVEEHSYDIVVLGCGHAGAQVAMNAMMAGGVTVAVLEASSEEGYLEIGSEVAVVNSQFDEDRFGVLPVDTGEVTNEYVSRSNGYVNPNLIRSFVENSGAMFDNAVAVMGETQEGSEALADDAIFLHLNVGEDGVFDPSAYPIVNGGRKSWAGCNMFKKPGAQIGRDHNGPVLLGCMNGKAKELGAEYFYSMRAVVLEQDADGGVTGVIAQNEDGSYVRFNAAKGVAVCTGDFSGNGPMCWALCTEVADWNVRNGVTYSQAMDSWSGASGPTRIGDGHKMCIWAGGHMQEAPRCTQGSLGGGPSGPWGNTPMPMFNSLGKRFMNEADFMARHGVCARQPLDMIVQITDTQYLKTVVLSGVEHGGPNFGRPEFFTDLTADMEAAEQAALQGETTCSVHLATIGFGNTTDIMCSDTLEGLADVLGYEGAAKEEFLAQVAHYNELCYAGVDSDYGKEAALMIPVDQGPFFGWKSMNSGGGSVGLVTLCGIVTTDDMNVVDGAGEPIRGLYCAGNTLGYRYGAEYVTPIAGSTIGMAMTHGYLLGRELAAL